MKICGLNWCKDAPKLKVSSFLEQAIEEKKKQLEIDEIHNKDPYLQEIVLHNFLIVSFFGCNKPSDNDCKREAIWYQDKLWKPSVQMFGKCTLDQKFLKSHEKIGKYLKRYTKPLVMNNVVCQFILKKIKSHQNRG